MTHCDACQAPNPAGRDTCFACAAPLHAAAPAAAAPAARPPDPNIRPCPGCGRMVARFHRACPGCGQLTRSTRVSPGGVPRGWIAAALPDGTVQLTRGRGTRLNDLAAAAIIAAVFVVWVGLMFAGPTHGGSRLNGPDSLVLTGIHAVIVLACGALVVGSLLWALCREEEWRVGPDLLEVRRRFFGREWSRSYGAASLFIRSHRQTMHPWGRTCALFVEAPGSQDCLYSGWLVSLADMEDLGRFLADRTGWQLRVFAGWFSGSERDPYQGSRL